ncbi:DUF2292 domain-containing protein [Paenibacillus hemerocallicola]|jgi:hypothetical protein|uniref:DUF2292 domain-containing protein n=1 Tax=Paenibacillus hemerocallicola TaxID=1172614 RepID=A0A5C4T9H4_9BACL|nr:YezD family protein [Paenibacillus hemerocallicola]TNJ65366.1 DUF2292 domain-containing protein [Paenibacillus hemerocallicola]
MGNAVQLDDVWADRILSSVKGLEYGNVQIIVHDGKIVQIERTERKRFDSYSASPGRSRPEPLKQQSR